MQESKIIQYLYNTKHLSLDDCYFFDNKYIITTDTISEQTHFKHEWSSPKDIAEKLVEVNVSDIAADGGLPIIAFLNLGLSEISKKDLWIKQFLKNFKNKLNSYDIKLAGGDTYKSATTSLTLTLIGRTNKPVLRNSGKPNQYIYLTGSLGLSYLGYLSLKGNKELPHRITRKAIQKHLRPKARLDISRKLVKLHKISAMMDITDGLIQDSEKLALASNLELIIEINKLPLLSLFKKYLSIDEIISSGEELELLFLSKEKIHSISGCPITCIGETKRATRKSKVTFTLDGKIYTPQKKGFLHFQ